MVAYEKVGKKQFQKSNKIPGMLKQVIRNTWTILLQFQLNL